MATDQDGSDEVTDAPEPNGELREMVRELAGAVVMAGKQLAATRTQLSATTGMVQAQGRMQRSQRFVTYLLVVVVALAIGGGSYFVITTNDVVHKVRDSQVTGQNTQRQINDCVTPGGKCYEDGQRRTATLVAQITDANHNGIPDVTEIIAALKR